MSLCSSDKATPRTSNKDYAVILLYRVCQGQRKGQFSLHGDTVPRSPLSCHRGGPRAFHPHRTSLVPSLCQEGSPAAPSLIGSPHSLDLLPSVDSIFH